MTALLIRAPFDFGYFVSDIVVIWLLSALSMIFSPAIGDLRKIIGKRKILCSLYVRPLKRASFTLFQINL